MMKYFNRLVLPKKYLVSLDILLLVFLSLYVLWGVKKIPFHGDESMLISMSNDYYQIFDYHETKNVKYHEYLSRDQIVRLTTGSISPFTFWLAYKIAAITPNEINGIWCWYPSDVKQDANTDMWEWNKKNGTMPGSNILYIARLTSAFFLVLSIILLFFFVKKLTQLRGAAWLAVIIYSTSPAILVNGRRALQEGVMLFSIMLLAFITLNIILEQKHKINWRKMTGYYILLGLVSGFSMACKQTSLIVIAPCYLSIFLSIFILPGEPLKNIITKQFFNLIASVILSVGFFLVFMPVWWGFLYGIVLLFSIAAIIFLFFNFWGASKWFWGIRAIPLIVFLFVINKAPDTITSLQWPARITIGYREWIMNLQKKQTQQIRTVKESSKKIVEEMFFANAEYYEVPVWKNYTEINKQIHIYEASGLGGRSGGPFMGGILVILAILGLVQLFIQFKNGHVQEVFLIAFWFLVPFLTLLLINTLPWQRYYILLQINIAIISAMGFIYIKKLALNTYKK